MKNALTALAVVAASCILSFVTIFNRLPVLSGTSIGEMVSRDLLEAAGRRFFAAGFTPNRMIAVGAYRPVDLQAVAFNLRVTGGTEPSGLYFIFFGGRDSAFDVTVRGRRLDGNAWLAVHGNAWLDESARQNLLESSHDLSNKHFWPGDVAAEPTADRSATRLRFDSMHTNFYQTSAKRVSRGVSYQASFSARTIAGGSQLLVFVNREGGLDGEEHMVKLTQEWRRYTLRHYGNWTGVTAVQVGFQRLEDITFELKDVRLTRLPSIDEVARFWPSKPRLDAQTLSDVPPVDAPDGARTFVIRNADTIALVLYGTHPFAYELDRVCVDLLDDAQPAEQAGECRPVTTFP